MANIEENVEKLVKKPIEDLGYCLYDVQYVKQGQDYYLRIFIEKPNGSIDLNDCETVNNGINDLLDKANYIKEQYFLEVSSTWIEKILRKDEHLKQNIGREVQINLFKSIEIEVDIKGKKKKEKQKEIIGKLENFNENEIILKLDNGNVLTLPRKDISQIKTIFDWDSLK